MSAMATENFRAQYYDKVGFRGNKSLEILLSEKPIDLKKLSNFCRKFCLPAIHRFTVWKVLLGVLPTFEENASVFEKDQTDQYNALKRSLLVMRVVNDDTRPPEVVVLMYLLGEGQLHLDIEQQAREFFPHRLFNAGCIVRLVPMRVQTEGEEETRARGEVGTLSG
ncbi:unnamed protein product [Ixodes pacificus]